MKHFSDSESHREETVVRQNVDLNTAPIHLVKHIDAVTSTLSGWENPCYNFSISTIFVNSTSTTNKNNSWTFFIQE
jgi:hypothetical protein